MTENKLKLSIGLFVVFSQLSIFVSILFLYFLGGFLFDEMTTTIALIMPMFSIYTAAIIKYMVLNRHEIDDNSRLINFSYILISFSIPTLFVVLLGSTVYAKAYNFAFSSFEQFKSLLAIIESLFGIYLGLILSSMFETKIEK